MKIKMLKTGKYSWDGKTLIKCLLGETYESIENDIECTEGKIHESVAKQWIDQGVCREIIPRKKK